MLNQIKIMDLYNSISDEKIDINRISLILPKIYMILNKIHLDSIEIVKLIDVLFEINELNMLDKVTSESVDLVIKTTKDQEYFLDGTLYFPILLKHIVLPYDIDRCNKEYDVLIFLSEFEIVIELMSKLYKSKDYRVLDKYNHKLKELVLAYKNSVRIYKRNISNELVLSTILSHIATMFYFKQNEYDYNYGLLEEVAYKLVENYQDFISYCANEDILRNFNIFNTNLEKIREEYIISENILKYVYEKQKEKRMCK